MKRTRTARLDAFYLAVASAACSGGLERIALLLLVAQESDREPGELLEHRAATFLDLGSALALEATNRAAEAVDATENGAAWRAVAVCRAEFVARLSRLAAASMREGVRLLCRAGTVPVGGAA